MDKTAILILAAGASTRMGHRDKLLEPVDGVPLLRRQAMRARAVCDDVVVALPPGRHPRQHALAGLDVRILGLAESAEGINGTLRAAFARLDDRDRVLLLLADLPEITEDDMRTVLQAAETHPEMAIWRGATEDGHPGHPILFDRSVFAAFATLTGDRGGREVVAAAGDRVHLVRLPGGHARRDLDTPEDWARWRAERDRAG